MKTTLNVDDRLMREAKKLAAERGVTLTSVIEESLRAMLAARTRRPSRLRWTVVKGKRLPTADISDRDALYEAMEGRR